LRPGLEAAVSDQPADAFCDAKRFDIEKNQTVSLVAEPLLEEVAVSSNECRMTQAMQQDDDIVVAYAFAPGPCPNLEQVNPARLQRSTLTRKDILVENNHADSGL
jgi:hypothetical protein